MLLKLAKGVKFLGSQLLGGNSSDSSDYTDLLFYGDSDSTTALTDASTNYTVTSYELTGPGRFMVSGNIKIDDDEVVGGWAKAQIGADDGFYSNLETQIETDSENDHSITPMTRTFTVADGDTTTVYFIYRQETARDATHYWRFEVTQIA